MVYELSADGTYAIVPLVSASPVLRNRALRHIVGEFLEQDVSLVHIKALSALLQNTCPSARISLPHGLQACRRYDRLFFRWKNRQSSLGEPTKDALPLSTPGETEIPGIPWKITCKIQKKFIKMTNTPFHFAIKYDMICAPQISVRSRQVGDRLQTAGGHSKSLKKLMIDRRIPQQERNLLPVLTDGESILAVGGLGVSSQWLPAEGQPALIVTISPI